jgi:SAM-dependent methyltransferase
MAWSMTNLALGTNEIEFWNGVAADRWVTHQAELDARIAVYGRAAIDALRPVAGERVLDVGCGCGDTVLTLAERVGAAGRVVGLDVSRRMLERARERARGATHVDLALEDAAVYRPSEPFDAICSRFGVMFFAKPVAAFANLRSTLRPGGRMAFVCWRAIAENPWAAVPLGAALSVVPPPPPAPEGAPGPFAFADEARVRAVLGEAGFADVTVTPFDAPMLLGETLEAALRYASEMGPAARLMSDLSPADSARVMAALEAALAPHGPRVALTGAVWVVSARRPD